MADILPSRPELPDDEDKEPRVVGLDSDEVDELLAAISSETARGILAELHEEPGTPSEIATRVDTTIQNAQYHLERLETAGLIESAGTAYSEKGREMTVYAPSDRALVVVAGDEDDTSGLQSALTQLLGGLGAVALGSVIVDRLVRRGTGPTLSAGGGDGGAGGDAADVDGATNATAEPTATETPIEEDAATPTETPSDGGEVGVAEVTETPTPEATPTETPMGTVADAVETTVETTRTVTESGGGAGPVDAVASAVAGLPPGVLFFLGGVVALAFVALVWRQ
jgi:DNA-binding transcriptional ArsR family regulator